MYNSEFIPVVIFDISRCGSWQTHAAIVFLVKDHLFGQNHQPSVSTSVKLLWHDNYTLKFTAVGWSKINIFRYIDHYHYVKLGKVQRNLHLFFAWDNILCGSGMRFVQILGLQNVSNKTKTRKSGKYVLKTYEYLGFRINLTS